MAEISFKNVSKAYGLTKALENVSFTCKEGEFFSIFGPSGAGKTSIIKNVIKKLNNENRKSKFSVSHNGQISLT